MFSLIITIVSIALVTALALATIYYGGSSFKQGSASAQAAQSINEGQQIEGASQVYAATTGTAAASLNDLIASNYLTSVPAGSWKIIDGAIFSVMPADNCLAVNKTLGITTIPVCGDATYVGKPYCCSQP